MRVKGVLTASDARAGGPRSKEVLDMNYDEVAATSPAATTSSSNPLPIV